MYLNTGGTFNISANYVQLYSGLGIQSSSSLITTYYGTPRTNDNTYIFTGFDATFVTRDVTPSLAAFIRILDVNTLAGWGGAIRGSQIILGTMNGLNGSPNNGGPAVTRFTIDQHGNIYFNAYTSNGTLATTDSNGRAYVSSDVRLKDNITYITDTCTALTQVNNLKPATFTFKNANDIHLGFIAQDVEQQIPLAVDGKKHEWEWQTDENLKPILDENGELIYKTDMFGNKIIRPRGLTDRALIATQTLAIQELSKQIDILKGQMATVLARIA